MGDDLIPLSLNDTFTFSCSKQVSCFNDCCRDLNQFLTPYDILRLKYHLKMSSSEFLERYTQMHAGPESGLPIITLKPNYGSDLQCPFVTPNGCSVYEDRPSSCRTYPIVRVVSRHRETGKLTEQYLMLQEPHCLGFKAGKTQTLSEWIEDQGIGAYNEMNDMVMDLISLKNRFHPGPMDMKDRYLFNMACYDLDRFRSHIFDKGLIDDLKLDSNELNAVRTNDISLLKLSFYWIRRIFLKSE
jgi:Fe-S-cluster containining protein